MWIAICDPGAELAGVVVAPAPGGPVPLHGAGVGQPGAEPSDVGQVARAPDHLHRLQLQVIGASYLHKRKVSVVGAAAGAVAGLVAITPASGYVNATGALIIGLSVGAICYSATLLRERLRIDDALDVFAVHGVGGMFGAVATGVLAVAAIGAARGAIDGNIGQVGIQVVAVVATVLFAAGSTFVIVKVVDAVLGLRVAPADELVGLDIAVHGESAYQS